MDLARASEQRAAMAIGIVDFLHGPLDPVDCPLRELEREAGAPARREIGDGIERRIHIGSPAGRSTKVDEAVRAYRAVDRLAQARLECLVIGVNGCCGHVQLAE
jgi:hypothetical protein